MHASVLNFFFIFLFFWGQNFRQSGLVIWLRFFFSFRLRNALFFFRSCVLGHMVERGLSFRDFFDHRSRALCLLWLFDRWGWFHAFRLAVEEH